MKASSTTKAADGAETRWASTASDLPSRKRLYRLVANLQGIVLEATVFSHGAKAYACATLLDGRHVPNSPAGGFVALQEAIARAKRDFTHWCLEILRRV